MADLLARSHPLEPYLSALDALPDELRITAEPFVALADLRVDPASGVQVRGAALPTTPNTWVAAGDGRLVWLGPDEWLVTSAGTAPEALEAELAEVLRPVGGVAVDVSAQRVGLRITGARAREVLAKGCAIDLHPRAFGRGSSAQTTLGQAGVVLLALGADGEDFAVLVRSSFAGYLATWLLDASLEYADPALTS
ncbi:sarcosine oxidase subunit gamma [Geodermatophilus sp. SYSU D00779]